MKPRACSNQGGRLAMMEPAMTTLGRWFYHYFHEEPVDMTADPYAPVTINPDRDPFDANQAIPTLLFRDAASRARLESAIPSLRVLSVDWQSLFAYPMSGGFQNWSLIPGRGGPPRAGAGEKFSECGQKASRVPDDGRAGTPLEHDPEKCGAVFRKDHARTKIKRDDCRSRPGASS